MTDVVEILALSLDYSPLEPSSWCLVSAIDGNLTLQDVLMCIKAKITHLVGAVNHESRVKFQDLATNIDHQIDDEDIMQLLTDSLNTLTDQSSSLNWSLFERPTSIQSTDRSFIEIAQKNRK